MKYLITGASGLLGGRLSSFLEKKGCQIIKGTRNLEFINSSNYSNWVFTDFDDFNYLKNICKGVDCVIHAAGPNAEECQRNPLSTFNFYSQKTKNFVEAAKAAHIKKFIFLSTAHVYDNNFQGSISEKSPTLNRHPYALANLEGERVVRKIFGSSPEDSLILRLSNIFGFPINKEVDCWSLFINNICKEIVINQTITINSNPLIKRDFISLIDFCELISRLSDAKFKFRKNNIINFGSEKSISLLEAAKLIKKNYCSRYQKDVVIIFKSEKKIIKDFRFINQFLEDNNLNIKFHENMHIEIKRLIEQCNKYFVP